MKEIKRIFSLAIFIIFIFSLYNLYFNPKLFFSISYKAAELYADNVQKIIQPTVKDVTNSITLISLYNEKNFKGSEIENIEKTAFQDNVDVYVKTLNSKDFVKYTKEKPYSITDKDSANYIDKNTNFKSSLKKNMLGKIEGIQLEEQKK